MKNRKLSPFVTIGHYIPQLSVPEVEGAQSFVDCIFATGAMQKNIPGLLQKPKCFVFSSRGSPVLAYIENSAEK